jgi:DNA-binding FadR family transcriptional regulator
MALSDDIEPLAAISAHERATPSLVYRSLLKSIHDGRILPGAKLPNERDIAKQQAAKTAS